MPRVLNESNKPKASKAEISVKQTHLKTGQQTDSTASSPSKMSLFVVVAVIFKENCAIAEVANYKYLKPIQVC